MRSNSICCVIVAFLSGLPVQRCEKLEVFGQDPTEVAARKAPFDEFTAELAAFIIDEVVEIRAERKRGRLPKAVPVDVLPGLKIAVQCVVFGFIRRGEEMLALHAQGAYFFIVHYGFPFVSARHIRHCSTRAPCGVSPCSGSHV